MKPTATTEPNRDWSDDAFASFVTRNPRIRRLLEYAIKVARTPYPVLITGETGTGKELIARGIHASSGRDGMFAPINCGAIPDHLFEAELFGAQRGAYTGLDADRPGLFRLADRGTLFLDEVAEMPQAAQIKLLRVLQDGDVRPLGSSKSVRVDVRVIAATHKDVDQLVAAGTFRSDLYFRIGAAKISLPPLRERQTDLRLLLEHAAAEAARIQGVAVSEISSEVVDAVSTYSWPGNVRELMHMVAAAVLSADGRPLAPIDFALLTAREVSEGSGHADTDQPFAVARAKFERDYMTRLVALTGGNLTQAAKRAGMARSTLRDKLRRYGLATASAAERQLTKAGKETRG